MRCRMIATVTLLATVVFAGCGLFADRWPDRQNRTPGQMLTDVVRWQQLRAVRESTGELRGQCFTDDDLDAFRSRNVPAQIVERLTRAPEFGLIADALRTLPRDQRAEAYRAARTPARPTWREMGFIDPLGRGQTEAGQRGERLVAAAIVDAIEAQVGGTVLSSSAQARDRL